MMDSRVIEVSVVKKRVDNPYYIGEVDGVARKAPIYDLVIAHIHGARFFVFRPFSDTLLSLSQSFIKASSLLIFISIFNPLLIQNVLRCATSVISSAYIIGWNKLLKLATSFMYIKNRRRPSIEPWGTPVCIGRNSDSTSSSCTY